MSPDTMKILQTQQEFGEVTSSSEAKQIETDKTRFGRHLVRHIAPNESCAHTLPGMMYQQRWSTELCWANLELGRVPTPPTHTHIHQHHTHAHTHTPSQYPGVQGETVRSSD